MAPTAERFVESTLRTVGIESCTTGYPPHCLILGFVNGLKYVCEKAAIWLVVRTMLNIRGRALKKKGKGGEDESEVQQVPERSQVSS